MELCNPTEIRSLLDRYGLSPRKGYGQNFLINRAVPEKIADCSASYADPSAPAGVLEIGPGIGALTRSLSERYDRVAAVEIDRGLIPLLAETLADCSNVSVTEADFMKLDLPAFLEENFGEILKAGGTVSVCANLPYYITTPVLMKLLEMKPLAERVPFASIVIMIQTEVARRLAAPAGSDEYGSVTVSVALRAQVEKLFDVSPGNFLPAPKVSSSVVGIIPHGGIRDVYPGTPLGEEGVRFAEETSGLIEMAFLQRRKTLVNALSARYPKETTLKALKACGLRADIRGERLSALDFCRLAGALREAE